MWPQEDIEIFSCNPRSDQEWYQIPVKDTGDLDNIAMANFVPLHKLFQHDFFIQSTLVVTSNDQSFPFDRTWDLGIRHL